MDDSYKVKLDIFEGPLDLLLYLIKKDEVDILDVNIERITHSSPATSAVLGSSSLIHAPPGPCCANWKGEPTIGIEDWFPDMPVSR